MALGSNHRKVAALACLAMLLAGWAQPVGSADSSSRLTTSQQEFTEVGLSRFTEQGLTLPSLTFEFHPTLAECKGHKGYYVRKTATLHMCSEDPQILLHELAHAWAGFNLSETDRQAFAAHLGLKTWDDLGQPWDRRATEHAAETIAWALMDEPNHVRFVENASSGTTHPVFRLLSIENSSVEDLHENFVLLTGMEPTFRSPTDWDSAALETAWQATSAKAASPELLRSG